MNNTARSHQAITPEPPNCVPKGCGADIELGNFMLGVMRAEGTDMQAAELLLREIDGIPHLRPQSSVYGVGAVDSFYRDAAATAFNPYEIGRKYLPATGGSAYIDQWHAELCSPEVVSAYDHVAVWHANLRIAQRALAAANAQLPPGQQLCVLVNNSDGRNSWGSHLNFLITRRAWNNLFCRKLHHQAFLAALQVSSICITGQGKVGADNRAPRVAFQLSQRADFFETLVAQQTTHHRPLLNARDESLCGSDNGLARYHCIFFDSSLSQVAHLLKVGIMQIGLAMLEAECVDTALALEDPVDAVVRWSHDPTLQARARMLSGTMVTIIELQEQFCEAARRFIDGGGCEGIVPRAAEILALWQDTLLKLKAGDLPGLAKRLDWALKLSILTRVLRQRPQLTWSAPEIRYLDQSYALLDRAEGLYWAHEAGGLVDRVVSDERIEHFVHNPPEDTRAWTRAMLLRLAPPDAVDEIDWDAITFELPGSPGAYRRVELDDPLSFTKSDTAHLFQDGADLEQVLEALGAKTVPAPQRQPRGNGLSSSWRPAYGSMGIDLEESLYTDRIVHLPARRNRNNTFES